MAQNYEILNQKGEILESFHFKMSADHFLENLKKTGMGEKFVVKVNKSQLDKIMKRNGKNVK